MTDRHAFVAGIPDRIETQTRALHGFGPHIPALFAAVGADYPRVCEQLGLLQEELLAGMAA